MIDSLNPRRQRGRSARVRADVHRAVRELARTQPLARLTLAQVAERSGVHLGTLYRRWRSLDGLLLDVVDEQLGTFAMPRTGVLRQDLEHYARRIAEDLAGPEGRMLLHALLTARLAADSGGGEAPNGTGRLPPALIGRFEDMRAALDNAAARGEKAPSEREFFDIVLAPLCASLLFDVRPGNPETVEPLVARLMRLVVEPRDGEAGSGAGEGAAEEATA
ncbi:TetR/AcrR family transcriptional regulator C-terminal ligand-binding domain-containing protein [Streptomyces sp. NPDC002734]|uniref:TetR/AcrR family transcriptional regulator n=1 Tax=Streptomyces sp. NPDC002734 TaxID=3154426 RepID=UPI00331D6B54